MFKLSIYTNVILNCNTSDPKAFRNASQMKTLMNIFELYTFFLNEILKKKEITGCSK